MKGDGGRRDERVGKREGVGVMKKGRGKKGKGRRGRKGVMKEGKGKGENERRRAGVWRGREEMKGEDGGRWRIDGKKGLESRAALGLRFNDGIVRSALALVAVRKVPLRGQL